MAFLAAWLILASMAQDPVRLGQEAFARRDFATAERWFRQAVQSHPRSALAHKLLGMTFAAREDYSQALEPFRRACELDPREENACYYLGRALYSVSRFEEAMRSFEIALAQQASRGRPLLGLAMSLEALGRNAEAEKTFKESIQAGERRALIDYGLFLHRQGRGRESIEYLRRAHAREELERVTRSVEAAGAGKEAAAPSRPGAVRFDPFELDMIVRNGATGKKHLIETMLAGVAVLDFDNDGWLDIFVSNGAEIQGLRKTDGGYWNRLFRNQRNGSFADVTENAGLEGNGYSMGAAAADFDNDGWTDLFVTGVRGNALYRNSGDGTFEEVTDRAGVTGDGSWAVAAGWFDYDSDGLLDLFVVNYVVWDPASEITCGPGIEGHRSYCHPRYYKPLPNALFRNLGNGKFRNMSAESGIAKHWGKGMGASFGDYDLDGFIDVFVANDTVANFLFHNEGNGTFVETALMSGVAYNTYGVAISSMGADFRDFDNDGQEDLFVTALSNEMFPLFRNLGDGRFADVGGPVRLSAASMPWSGWGNGSYDFNNDGWRDFFSANGHAVDNVDLISSRAARQPNVIFLSRRGESFESTTVSRPALHRGAAFGDFNRDGRIDILVTRLNESPLVLRNVSPGAGNWIRFALKGTRSNRDAIGARLEIETEHGRQWNRVNTCIGYAGSSERAVHFGIGAAERVRTLRIRWPSGSAQVLENLEAGRLHEISEPE
jgi:Tfp pilus assembly protein PilF